MPAPEPGIQLSEPLTEVLRRDIEIDQALKQTSARRRR
jgi:hypothetical protein